MKYYKLILASRMLCGPAAGLWQNEFMNDERGISFRCSSASGSRGENSPSMREIFELPRRRCRRAQDGSHEEQNTTKPRNIYRKVAKIHREHTVWSEPVIGKHIEEVEIEPVLLDTVAVNHPLQGTQSFMLRSIW